MLLKFCYRWPGFNSTWRSNHQTSKFSLRCFANSAFHPSKVWKWVACNTRANFRSLAMRVAPINHHWWYDHWLSNYNPGSVGCSHVDWVDGTFFGTYHSFHVFQCSLTLIFYGCLVHTSIFKSFISEYLYILWFFNFMCLQNKISGTNYQQAVNDTNIELLEDHENNMR